jgi:hypothetical protein
VIYGGIHRCGKGSAESAATGMPDSPACIHSRVFETFRGDNHASFQDALAA